MNTFAEHDYYAETIRKRVNDLKTHLPHGHILIKVDFIQNIAHRRGEETSSGYYNKRQTQLLVFVIWYHTLQSMPEKPEIKS